MRDRRTLITEEEWEWILHLVQTAKFHFEPTSDLSQKRRNLMISIEKKIRKEEDNVKP